MLLFQEGFDNYASISDFWLKKGVRTVDRRGQYEAATGKYGGGAFRTDAAGTNAGVKILLYQAPAANLIRMAFWFKANQAGATTGQRILFALCNNADTLAWQFYMTGSAGSGKLAAARFDDDLTATTVATSTATIGDNAWHHIELKLKVSDTVGIIDIKIDGVADTGISAFMAGDTNASAFGDCSSLDAVQFGGSSSNTANADQIWFDDIIVWDDQGTGFTGALTDMHKIRVNNPTANGTVNDFTPSTGSNFQNVDDTTPDDDSTYNESSTVGHIDKYATSAAGASPATIYAVVVENEVRRTGNKAMNVRGVLKQGGSTVNGTTVKAYPGFKKIETASEKAPDTGSWNASKLLATEFGLEYVS